MVSSSSKAKESGPSQSQLPNKTGGQEQTYTTNASTPKMTCSGWKICDWREQSSWGCGQAPRCRCIMMLWLGYSTPHKGKPATTNQADAQPTLSQAVYVINLAMNLPFGLLTSHRARRMTPACTIWQLSFVQTPHMLVQGHNPCDTGPQ